MNSEQSSLLAHPITNNIVKAKPFWSVRSKEWDRQQMFSIPSVNNTGNGFKLNSPVKAHFRELILQEIRLPFTKIAGGEKKERYIL